MRSLLKYFFVLSVFLLFSCSKITHKLMKGAAEEAVENSSDKTLRKLSKKALLEENSTYVGKSLEDQVLKKVIRKKITKEMEEEGVKSFFQYGTNKAAKKIAFISYSPAKKRMISETSSNLYLKNIYRLRKGEVINGIASRETKSTTKRIVKKISGQDAYDYLCKHEPKAAEMIRRIEKSLGNDHHLKRNMYAVDLLEDGSTKITARNGMEHCSVIVKGSIVKGSSGGFVDNGNLNEFFNIHMPNMTYIVNDCAIYKTDKMGRVISAKADRTKMAKASRVISKKRDRMTESRVVDEHGGQRGIDDGGHLFSNNSNGSNNTINQVPMNKAVNRNKEWRKFEETEEKYIKSNHLVLSSRTLLYKGNNLRPYAIKVEFWVDGKKMKYKPNPIYI
ncbi:DNA/RNA non-specific endonuclease [Hallella colorans]|uniref:DNA/RNA non-specific endonuclease n=1 Tax=Hallella colorans TaxID=1703337 RepID=UPI00248E5BB9|nr:DNA/RNA non-specific endonuclease [Hallella colorans]